MDTLLVQPEQIDTESVIKDIRKKYSFVISRKKFSRTENENNYTSNEDKSDEYNGDYSLIWNYDTTFYVSDSLKLIIFCKEEENQTGKFYTRTEDYYANDVIFFSFEQKISDRPFSPGTSGVEEKRTYFYKNNAIRCLYRELFLDDISTAKDSITKIVSVHMNSKTK